MGLKKIIVAVILALVDSLDGRSYRVPPSRRYSLRTSAWEQVQESLDFEAWFELNLR